MKNILLLNIFLFIIINGIGQQDVQFTHFKEYALFYNPAYAGVGSDICADLIGRNQWAGFGGAPKSYFFDTRFTSRKLHGGLGLAILNDELGFQKNTSVSVSYSYKKIISTIGELYLGLSMGVNRGNWDGNFIPPQSLNDPYIPNTVQSLSVFNSNIGVFYKRKNLYMGLSVSHINQGVFKNTVSQFNLKMIRHYYILAGYKTKLTQQLEIEPSVFAKSDGVSTQMDIKTIVLYNNQFFGGINYRLEDAVSPILGVQVISGVSKLIFSYSYDITTSKMRNYSSGSHELSISYCRSFKQYSERHGDPRNLGK